MTTASSKTNRADEFLSFVNASPTPFHAVHSAKRLLEQAGFKQIKERDSWVSSVKAGGKYYLTRNGSSIIAFTIGARWRPGSPIAMVGTHTDSPCLRVKPVSKKQNDGYMQVGVETYGSGMWHTWFDRDLSIAGRAMIKDQDESIIHKLVKVDKPILRIPNLAIHLDRQEEFKPNRESHLFPIVGMVAAELNRRGNKDETDDDQTSSRQPLKPLRNRHHSHIVDLIAEEAGVNAADVLDFEMLLYDTQKACRGGLNDELIFSARLDNLMMSFCSTMGLIESAATSAALEQDVTIRLIALFDHEEVGSLSAQGADSNLLPVVIRRLSLLPPVSDSVSDDSYDKIALEESATAYEQTLSKSFLVSADMAHAVHPNYPAKYESDHRPEMNKGPVIKVNANQRYATNSPGIVLLQEAARRARSPTNDSEPSANSELPQNTVEEQRGIPLQLFVIRNDSPCGSTIGPMLSAALGARTLDIGNAQLSMHSIRETAGAHDVEYAVKLFESFFTHYADLERKIIVD